jgi:ribosomal protein S18 acetylase RimI-like enzyme
LNFRGKGIIRKNFKKILRLQLLKNNKIKLLLLGVDKNNLHAITLYKKLGFKYKTKNKRKMYYKI